MKRWCFNSFLIVLFGLPPGLKAQVVNHYWPISTYFAVTKSNGNYQLDTTNNSGLGAAGITYGRTTSLLNCDSQLIFFYKRKSQIRY